MSRLASAPVALADGVVVSIAADGAVTVKGKLGELTLPGDHNVSVTQEAGALRVKRNRDTKHARSLEGTFVRRLENMVTGVTKGMSRLLELHGTGYRANVQGRRINLELGFSHPVSYSLPDGVDATTPAQNRILLKGIDKIIIGQVAAEIRAKRPPEPYKGKGVRYAGEQIVTKETKKK